MISLAAVLLFPLTVIQSATAATVVKAAAAPAPITNLSIDQAIAQAQRSGKTVPVPASTTATSTVTADPDGTVTLSEFAAPVRKKVSGTWKSLDATLQRHPDGSISPAVTSENLTFGAAGSRHLATQGSGAFAFNLDVPFVLPNPTLSGDTATYANVLNGVDLVATADEQGGFSEVFVLKNAAAAANPALSTLALSVPMGFTVSTDSGANIAVKDAAGNVVATAPTPLMWDSTQPTAAVATSTDPQTKQQLDTATGMPAASSVLEAGEAAHTAQIAVAAAGTTLKLTPDASMVKSTTTKWPVYLDPSFSNPHAGGSNNSWANIRSDHPKTSYVKANDVLRVGDQAWDTPYYKAESFIQFPLSPAFHGSTVIDAKVLVHETYAPSCTATRVDLYHSDYITSNATWDTPPGKHAFAGSATVAHGYNNSCLQADVPFGDTAKSSSPNLTGIMQTGADADWSKVAFGLYAHDENDKLGWKKFDNKTANLTIHYQHPPRTPTTSAMGTNPKTTLSTATTCAAKPTGVSTIGKGDVTFSVVGSDPDGGTIGLGFGLVKTSDSPTVLLGTTASASANMVASGTTFSWRVSESTLDGAAKDSSGQPVKTDFYWHVHVLDGFSYSPYSPSCHFIYDPTVPGAPSISTTATQFAVGTPTTFTIHPPVSGDTPASYQYNLNSAANRSVTAASGVATISVTPTRIVGNVLTVVAVSAGGNIGTQLAQQTFDATPGPAYKDNDLNGDTVPDQLTIGATTGTPKPGLWLATGTGTAGQFTTATKNIGINGSGISDPGSASDFNGGKPITGLFTGGTNQAGTQDQLVFYPSSGSGVILPGNGDGTIRTPTISISSLSLTNEFGYLPTQLVNAGNTSGNGSDFPDLLATMTSTGTGLALYLIPNGNVAGGYGLPTQLTSATPTGGTDWTNWRLASAQSTTTGTNLYLWNTTTKALYLWRSLAYVDNSDGTGSLTGNQYTISSNWNPSNVNSLEAADLNADGTTDLRVINTSGIATPYLITTLPSATALGTPGTTTATVTTKPTQTLTW